jgi:hypothetical protein
MKRAVHLPGYTAVIVMALATTMLGPGWSAQAQDQDEIIQGMAEKVLPPRPYSPYADRAFPTQVYFGDTHVHTGISADAGGSGTTLMPRDAYRFARGEQITSNTGQPVKLASPFDFYMITDHSDGMGLITDIKSGTPNIMADPLGKDWHERFGKGGETALRAAQEMIATFAQGKIPDALNYQPGNAAYRRVWDDIIASAQEFNDPGVFTTFIAYEWTSLVAGDNLHRNVIFRDGPERAGQIVPYSTTPPIGSRDPKDLWKWLAKYEDDTGGEVLAIPHNGNLSNGTMFALQDEFANGKPYDADYAKGRNKWERLYEATQIKGDGETHPLLSTEDEFADFETWDYGNLDASVKKTPEMLPGEYVRSGLQRGLMLEKKLGTNPFKFGLVGASDTHTGLTTPDNDNFFGKFASYEPSPERALHISKKFADGSVALNAWQYITSGLTAVWAESNTRGAIFDAMERREAYATTGPRIRLRFFGGWDFQPEDALRRDLAQLGYAKGVPMGADLPAGKGAPSFLVYALRDPMGANLDRVQIVKGWLEADGSAAEQVYDVSWSGDRKPDAKDKVGPVGNTVNTDIPSWTNTIGASELGTVWIDPDFDPAQSAFYYARVLEIPTPRWTAYDAVKFGLELPGDIPLTTQERAYSSPIWYNP